MVHCPFKAVPVAAHPPGIIEMKNRAPERNRTVDLILTMDMLCLLSYRGAGQSVPNIAHVPKGCQVLLRGGMRALRKNAVAIEAPTASFVKTSIRIPSPENTTVPAISGRPA